MRSLLGRSLAAVALLGVGAAFLGTACHHDKCDILPCGPIGGGGADDGGGGSGVGGEGAQGGGGQGGDGGGGTIDPGCIPSMLPTGESVPAECGVFVNASATGSGTKADPTGDLADALSTVPENRAVYICGTDTFTGTFTLAGGRSIFGGLACADWSYDAASRPRFLGIEDSPTLIVSGNGETKLEDLLIESPDAVGVGASSIALMIVSASVDVARSDISAGAGAKGASGMEFPAPAQAGGNGMPGTSGCEDATSNPGGDGGSNPACTMQSGGLGGTGTNTGSGGPGGPGDPSGTGGLAGVGQGVAGTCSGGAGGLGEHGNPGAAGSGLGSLTESYSPAGAAADAVPAHEWVLRRRAH